MIAIPPHSLPLFGSIDVAAALPKATELVNAFAFGDLHKNQGDPSRCRWIASFGGDKAVGWVAKGSIDADGPGVEVGYWDGVALDPDSGQTATSLKFANGRNLPSEGCPYAVLPGGSFGPLTGLALGDVGVVILGSLITAAVLGDIGPGTGPGHNNPKIGEYSIRVHNKLRPEAPDPCHRDHLGRCVRVINSSIGGGVIFIGFPGSAIPDLALETCQAQIEERAFGLWKALGGKLAV